MENKKVSNLRLWIILGVLIVCLGTSVAFFTVGYDFNGSGTKVQGETGDFVEVTFDAGSSTLNLQDAVPGSSTTKDFSVKITPNKTKDEVTYAIKINLTTNEFSYGTEHLEEIKYTLTEQETNKTYEGYISLGKTGDITLKNITKQEDAETTYNYSLKIEFLNIDADQNHNQNKSISGNLKVEFAEKDLTVSDILAKYTKDNSRSGEITVAFKESTPTTVYSKEDDDGTSYAFAGKDPNNWVRMGNMYFRIIRFNGNGSMRLIYSGEGSPKTNGEETQIGKKEFNEKNDDNAYVGLQYTVGQVHGTSTNSTILGEINSSDTTTLYGWYNNKIKPNYESLLDINVGFCSDRRPYTSYSGTTLGGGTGTTATYYKSINYKLDEPYLANPNLTCPEKEDKLALPVGLITLDEYMLAGGGLGNPSYWNTVFWLYTREGYWMISPYSYEDKAYVFYSLFYGNPSGHDVAAADGVRPVINLKSSTNFLSGDYDGSAEKPWIVSV